MIIDNFVLEIKKLGIDTFVGVPDSTLAHFASFLSKDDSVLHHVAPNEGAAVGLALGNYLSTGRPSCVYMQNSGLGNAFNPIASLANQAVYDIPMLLIVGWRGEPGKKDEPQHRFMGLITIKTLELLDIEYQVIDEETTECQLIDVFKKGLGNLKNNKQFAIIVKRGTFTGSQENDYDNNYKLAREKAIEIILRNTCQTDVIVSTTGKISRELYEVANLQKKEKGQAFLTVGGMGYASMIALGISSNKCHEKVYCLDGDGAILMHMGSLAYIAQENPTNMVHICLNNEAHESVGGMPTCAIGANYSAIAKASGYSNVFRVFNEEELREVLGIVKEKRELCFIEVLVSLFYRDDLGRPKEAAVENKINFMKYHGVIK